MHNTLQNTLQKSDIEIFCKIHNLDDIKKEIYLNVFFGEKSMDNLKKCWELCEMINASFNDETGDKLTASSIPQHYTKNKELNKEFPNVKIIPRVPVIEKSSVELKFSGQKV